MTTLRFALATATCVLALSSGANAANTEIFTGGSASNDSGYGYVGGVESLGHNLTTDGFMARASVGAGEYLYDRAPSSTVRGDVTDTDLMVGYQKFVNFGFAGAEPSLFSAYFGGDFIQQHLDRVDANNKAQGPQWGAKGLVEGHVNLCPKSFVAASFSYSDAFNTYWSDARAGYKVYGKTAVGPEASFLGNTAFNQQRYGVFVSDVALTDSVSLGASTGYADSTRKDGAYGDVSIAFAF